MLSKKEFDDIVVDLKNYEKKREIAIQQSREIIQLSKRIIYSIHRNGLKEADKSVKEINKKIKVLSRDDCDINIRNTAVQEYVEALCYYYFVKGDRIPTRKELNVDTESYLLGLCDLSGELVRKAVNEAINKDYDYVIKIWKFLEELYGQFLRFDLRNGELRKKMDSIKWNLKKVDDVVYDFKRKL